MINNITIEICIGNIQDALIAAKYPIDRIELNSALELGGLSATLETLKTLKKTIPQKICCMVRPRGGNFSYSGIEYKTMLKDAENFLMAGADGIVFGFLHDDSTIYEERTREMVNLIHSYSKEAVFHKAFDELEDLNEGTKKLIELNVDRILTSGKAVYPDILKGCETIHKLQLQYGDKIQFLPGGGVRIDNVQEVIKIAGTHQVHMTSKRNNPGGYVEFEPAQFEKIIEKIKAL